MILKLTKPLYVPRDIQCHGLDPHCTIWPCHIACSRSATALRMYYLDLAKRGFGLGFPFLYPPTGNPKRVLAFMNPPVDLQCDASVFMLLRGVDCVLCCMYCLRYKSTESQVDLAKTRPRKPSPWAGLDLSQQTRGLSSRKSAQFYSEIKKRQEVSTKMEGERSRVPDIIRYICKREPSKVAAVPPLN
jgi:hypothetical protein